MSPYPTVVKFAAVSACAVLLTACVNSQMPMSPANDDVEAAPPPPIGDMYGTGDEGATGCDLGAIPSTIGEPFDEANVAQLQSDSGAQRVRVLRPGDMATMDHRPDRLNVHLDDQDIIEDLRCG